MRSFIDNVRDRANGNWETILPALNITINKKEGPCPACGGDTRYRFDDKEGRGTYFCSRCGAGTGLDLVMKVNGCNATKAATIVAEAMALPLNQQEKPKKPAKEKPLRPIAERVAALMKSTHMGESVYLNNKALQGPHPLLKDGSLLLVLRTMSGTVTGAQTIRPTGEKRLLAGTKKKGAFIPVGDIPENPDSVVITEGYATALSLVVCGAELILAAIDAGNLLSVAQAVRERWPQTPIIIAGDNDVTPEGKNVGKHAAEEAARVASCLFAVPPTDHKADWNDYRQQNGVEALQRAFVASAVLPEMKIVEEVVHTEGNVVELKKTKGADLTLISDAPKKKKKLTKLGSYIDKRRGGLYLVERQQNEITEEIEEKEIWLSDEMETVGIGSDGKEGYIVIKILQEGTGKHIYEAMPRRELGLQAGWARLRSRQFNLTAKSAYLILLADYLQREGNRQKWEITQTAGWHCGAYVMPDGEIIGKPDIPIAFCEGTSAISGYIVRGTAESWREHVAPLIHGNHSMMLGVMVALAAPLNSLVGGGCFGVHLFAQSSAGKTTTVEAASSLYGVPEMLKLSWFATTYGLTVEAASRNDGFLPIDEIGQGGKAQAAADSAYNLFNGVGKVQGAREGGNRSILRWKIAALSTGEVDFETYLITNNIQPKAGQLVRLLSVPFIDTEAFNGLEDGDAHSRAIKRESQLHCGAAGREWIRWLTENKELSIKSVADVENEWLASLPEEASPQVRRVASRFALLDAAGKLAGHITGWEPQECTAAIKRSFNDWLEDYGLGNREKHQVITRARDFIQRFGMSRFQPYTYGKPNGDMDKDHAARINNLAGYLVSGRRDDGRLEYHMIPSVFEEEILRGVQRKVGVEALQEVGMLVRDEKGRVMSKTISINGTQQRFYVLLDVQETE